MIEINIDPTMFQIGGFAVTWHGLFTAVGVLIGVVLTARLAASVGLTEDLVYSGAVWVVIGGIIGARLLYVLEHFEQFSAQPDLIIRINEGGISIYGALIGGFVGGAIFCWLNKVNVGDLADITAPGLVLGLGVGRIGDIINGEHHGVASNLPWSVRYTNPNTAGELNVSVHPTVAYELIWDFVVAWIVWRVRPRLPHPGMAFILFAVLYSVGRFVFSFLRKDEARVFGNALSVPQLIALLVFVIGIPFFLYLNRRPAATPAPVAETAEAAPEGTPATPLGEGPGESASEV